MTTRGKLVGLDMVRGLAIALVLTRHASGEVLGGAGIVGVVVFFALSGYLITGVLDRDLIRYGRIRWGRFYRNRALRLVPALLGLLIVFSLVEIIWHPLNDQDILLQSILLGITYTSDLPLPWEMSIGLGHLWTLAVEEQFYLLWPLVLAFAYRFKFGVKGVALFVALGLTAGNWIGLYLANEASDVYSSPLTWASSMAIGGVGYYYRHKTEKLPRKITVTCSVLGLAALLFLSAVPGAKESYLTYTVWPTIIAVATLAVIAEAVRWRRVEAPFLRILVILGNISYGAYLWNMPIVVWVRLIAPEEGIMRLVFMVGTIPFTLIMAALSWYSLEAIGRRWRENLDRRQVSEQRLSRPSITVQSTLN